VLSRRSKMKTNTFDRIKYAFLDIAHLSAGLYFVEVQVKDRVEVVKLVKE
jgi:hypothetical protein